MSRGRLMQSLPADPDHSRQPALTHLDDEVCATIARLFAYVGTLALVAILAVHGCDRLQIMLSEGTLPDSSWAAGNRAHQAFQPDPAKKSESYTVVRPPPGDRKNIPRWAGSNGRPLAKFEFDHMRAASTAFAIRTNETGQLETAGPEFKQGGYAGAGTSAASADWMTGAETPQLRGTL
jgi:hypothetical protein